VTELRRNKKKMEFYELEIWKKGFELLTIIYRVTSKYPQEEKYNLTSQTRGSANSVIAQIAESHGRFWFADKVRVLYQARGEVEETRSHLRVGFTLHYLSEKDYNFLDKEYEGLAVGINSYIKSLLRNKKS